jgi:hypothetical protein
MMTMSISPFGHKDVSYLSGMRGEARRIHVSHTFFIGAFRQSTSLRSSGTRRSILEGVNQSKGDYDDDDDDDDKPVWSQGRL